MTSLRSGSVVADSNVLLSAVARRGAWRVFEETDLVVVTTDFTIAEVEEYMPEFGERYGIQMDRLYAAVETLPVVRYGESEYISHLKKARRVAWKGLTFRPFFGREANSLSRRSTICGNGSSTPA